MSTILLSEKEITTSASIMYLKSPLFTEIKREIAKCLNNDDTIDPSLDPGQALASFIADRNYKSFTNEYTDTMWKVTDEQVEKRDKRLFDILDHKAKDPSINETSYLRNLAESLCYTTYNIDPPFNKSPVAQALNKAFEVARHANVLSDSRYPKELSSEQAAIESIRSMRSWGDKYLQCQNALTNMIEKNLENYVTITVFEEEQADKIYGDDVLLSAIHAYYHSEEKIYVAEINEPFAKSPPTLNEHIGSLIRVTGDIKRASASDAFHVAKVLHEVNNFVQNAPDERFCSNGDPDRMPSDSAIKRIKNNFAELHNTYNNQLGNAMWAQRSLFEEKDEVNQASNSRPSSNKSASMTF